MKKQVMIGRTQHNSRRTRFIPSPDDVQASRKRVALVMGKHFRIIQSRDSLPSDEAPQAKEDHKKS